MNYFVVVNFDEMEWRPFSFGSLPLLFHCLLEQRV